ncbi:MAG: TA system VapC family ribonuclease toxin [Acidobacteriota bacterium]
MRAIDTNVLIYSELVTSPWHDTARRLVQTLAEGRAPWAIPWPCIYEFLRVVTHPRVLHPPMPVARAMADLRAVLGSPSLVLLSETSRHADVMADIVMRSGASGNLLHDAHIAALCLEHGVSEIVTGDRDFARFPDLRVVNPFA